MRLRTILLAGAAVLMAPSAILAQGAGGVEQVVVIGTLSDSGIGLARDKVAGSLQSLSSDQFAAGGGATVLTALGSRVPGVTLSDTQGNGMFQDLRFHGFEASPLQGVPQGVAVYQNGMRLNEAFGDTVNWDAIPQAAIARLDVWSANPVFGLNALGGAVNMVMKNGFTWDGTELSAQGGSFAHGMATAQYGAADGDYSFYGAAEGVTDGGWRLHSGSDLVRLYGDIGWRGGDSELHLVAAASQSGLDVVGPTPVEAVARNSKAVFTWPQTTQNRIASLTLAGKARLADHWQLDASAYARTLRQRHVDGNDADFERCSNSSSFVGKLCLEDDAFTRPSPFTGAAALNFRNQFAILDQNGASIPFMAGAIYGSLDRTYTDTGSFGGTVQLASDAPLLGFGNYFTAGGSIDHGAIGFRSTSTLSRIFPDLSVAVDSTLAGSGSIIRTNGNLGYAPVTLKGTTDYYGAYAVDALDLTPDLTVTAGLRLNAADIVTADRSGTALELTGSHGYAHVNPMAAITWRIADAITAFGAYSEANRAPTPLELNCADPSRPCLLEGALVADPALKQVVAHTGEVGLRGGISGPGGAFSWSASLFRTDSDNDIVALASAIQGRGYFTNVAATRRQGFDLTSRFTADGWSTYAAYSFLDATYQFGGTLASPNNPAADAAGNVVVTPGRHIPLNPASSIKAGGEWQALPGLTLGADLVFTGSQYYDGDHANQNAKLPDFTTVSLHAAYDVMPGWQIFGLVDNLFDSHAASFGTYFEPGDTKGLYSPALSDPRMITRLQPLSLQLGLRLKL
jgi:iron complex outermembrane receptor protein